MKNRCRIFDLIRNHAYNILIKASVRYIWKGKMTSINPVQDNRATMSKLFRFPNVCVALYMHQEDRIYTQI